MYFDLRKLKHLRRQIYGLRAYIPGLRERHLLEIMVGPLGFWDQLQAYQLNLLKSNGLKPDHKLLDIGCGPLQGGIAFIKYLNKGNYYGFDKSINVIKTAKEQIIKNRLSVKEPFVAYSESFGLNEIDGIKFDFMWASQILYYFDENLMRSLMNMISLKIKDTGKFLGDIIGPKHYEFRLKEHNWKLYTAESLKNIGREYGLIAKELKEISQYGYPPKLSLKTNLLIEITKE